MTDHTRRGLLRGAGALFLCAPAIVRATSLDAIKGVPMALTEARLLEEMQQLSKHAETLYGSIAWIWYEPSKTEWFDASGRFIQGVYRDPWSVANGQHP